MRKVSTDFEAPARVARRMRYKSLIFGSLIIILFGITLAIASEVINLDSDRGVLFSITALFFCLFFAFMIWNALRYNYVPCPRYGWNIFFQKTQAMMAFNIPSICPNCGLDLEHRYSPESGATKRSA